MNWYICFIYLFTICFIYTTAEISSTSNIPVQNEKEGKFWQITDIHWDLEYSEAGDAKNMCHESSGDTLNSTGHFGNFLCDSPYTLVRSALHAMKNIEPNPNFIVWTGDNAPHVEEVKFPVIFQTIRNVTEEMISLFGSKIPFLPVLGNHDSFPQDDFPASLESFYTSYLDEGNWKSVIPVEAQKDFKKGGYYKVNINPHLNVVILNTNLYYKYNQLGEGLKDPGSQFKWLRNALEEAKNMTRKVLIAAHAPPGYWERLPVIPFLNDTYNDEFIDILNEYGDAIIGQIYGHEHTDSFRIFGTSNDDVKSVGFLAPAVTPWYPFRVAAATPVNPSVRLYTFSDNVITDYIQYHMNLTQANKLKLSDSCALDKNNNVECSDASRDLWKEYYRATKAFGVNVLDVNNMRDAFLKLSSNDTYFQTYYRRNSAGIENGYCNKTCKRNHLCAISHMKIMSLVKCLNSSDQDSSSLYHLFDSSYDVSGMETLTFFSIALFFSVSLGVLILVFLLRRKSSGSSNSTASNFEYLANNRNGYRPLSTIEGN